MTLLFSAVKFTSEGEIIVNASSHAVAKSPSGHDMCKVTITVKDTGIGIAKEHFGRLFRCVLGLRARVACI